MRNSQVFSDERPSKRSMPWITPRNVSDTTSSAASFVATYMRATRSMVA